MSTKLSGIPETLLIALWARASETKTDTPIIRDDKAVEMVSQIDYDFSKFSSARLSQLGVAIRTMILDKAVSGFLKQNPEAVVINLGAGLDTRYARLSAGGGCWYDLDVPEVIDLRRRFFTETERYRLISKSMFDPSWMDEVKAEGKPVLLIAEGLFMYFEEAKLKSLFKQLLERFPGAELLFEMLAPMLVGRSKRHDAVSKIGSAEFKWGLIDARDVAHWHPNIEFIEEWNYSDYYKERWGWFRCIARLPFLGPRVSSRIVHLRFANPVDSEDLA